MLIDASQSPVALLGRRVWAFEQLLAAFEEHRDSTYDCVTDANGQYETEADRQYILEMDRIIDNARREIGMLKRTHASVAAQTEASNAAG